MRKEAMLPADGDPGGFEVNGEDQMQTAFALTREIKQRWEALYYGATNDPASWQRQLPNALKALIDESLGSLEFWLDNTLLHNEHITEFLPQLLETLKEIESGNYSQLNHFINELTHLMTTIHTMPLSQASDHSMEASTNQGLS